PPHRDVALELGDVHARPDEPALGVGDHARARRVILQVPDRRIVEGWAVQVRAPGSEQRQRQSGADRMRSRRHGQNPTLTVNQKVRLRGYWATSILRATGWIPKLLTSGSIPV